MAALSVDGTPMPALPNSADQINYDNTTSGLSATTVKGAVDELASEKQDKSDNSLQTTNKTIVGGINELRSGLNDVNSNLTKKTTVISETNAIGNAYNIAGVICLAIYDGGQFSCNANDVIFTLPTGFRPSVEVQVVNTASGHERILINSSGQVIAKDAFSSSYARFTITFM